MHARRAYRPIWAPSAALFLSLPAAAGCVAGAPESRSCTSELSAALVGGRPDFNPTRLPLRSKQVIGIGAVENEPGATLCSGTVVAPRWVATGRHCLREYGLWFATGVDGPAVRVRVARQFPHPDRDIALLHLEPHATFNALEIEAIPLASSSLGADWIGRVVTLAGLGDSDTGARGRRLFLEEPIIALSDRWIDVDGGETTGACQADSGGPLLALRPGSTTVEILGTLSQGSTTCRGVDKYERVDSAIAWVADTMEAVRRNPCGDLTSEGTCFQGNPRWCAGDHAASDICDGPRVCGWNAGERGYRCVDEDADPCRGLGPLGDCEGSVFLRCERGRLLATDCAGCGGTCMADANGNVGCGGGQ